MPAPLLLIILGVVLIVLAYYLPMPPPLNRLCMGVGVICVAVGLILLVYALLVGGTVRAALGAAGVA